MTATRDTPALAPLSHLEAHRPIPAPLAALEVHDPSGEHRATVYAAAEHGGHLELLHRLNGWAQRSRPDRVRFLYRVDGPPPASPAVLALDARGQLIAGTRPPANLAPLDPSGPPWETVTGGPATAPTLTPAEADRVRALFAEVDHRPGPASAPRAVCPREDYNRRTTWAELLTPAGWRMRASGAEGWAYWARPAGFLRAPQAGMTVLGPQGDRLCVYAGHAAPFQAWTFYDPFSVYAVLHHGGDDLEAAAALLAQGYGHLAHEAAA